MCCVSGHGLATSCWPLPVEGVITWENVGRETVSAQRSRPFAEDAPAALGASRSGRVCGFCAAVWIRTAGGRKPVNLGGRTGQIASRSGRRGTGGVPACSDSASTRPTRRDLRKFSSIDPGDDPKMRRGRRGALGRRPTECSKPLIRRRICDRTALNPSSQSLHSVTIRSRRSHYTLGF